MAAQYPHVRLNELLAGEHSNCIKLRASLEARGWCFVELTDDVMQAAEACLNECINFFKEPEEIKKTYAISLTISYWHMNSSKPKHELSTLSQAFP